MEEGVMRSSVHVRRRTAGLAAVAAVFALISAAPPASAQPSGTTRGPNPTVAMIEASRGPFATAQLNVAPGNGFNGGTIYYPTDTSLGTWGAVAIMPGYTALFRNEEAWMGPWLSSFGFVVIGVETLSRTDSADARGTELLAALTYLTQRSPVRDRVDPARLSVIGHSAGGAGAILAAERQPSLRAAVGLAPGSPVGNTSLATDHVPMMIVGGQRDAVVTPTYLTNLYATVPAPTQSDFVQIAGADHVYYTHPNNVEMKVLIPWLKTFVDGDARYTPFLCPKLPDPNGISLYRPKCPYAPPAGRESAGNGGTRSVRQ
jgi:dienelactone hydrolase